jgi:hypothetical protein
MYFFTATLKTLLAIHQTHTMDELSLGYLQRVWIVICTGRGFYYYKIKRSLQYWPNELDRPQQGSGLQRRERHIHREAFP